jgi:hypothetical protein
VCVFARRRWLGVKYLLISARRPRVVRRRVVNYNYQRDAQDKQCVDDFNEFIMKSPKSARRRVRPFAKQNNSVGSHQRCFW